MHTLTQYTHLPRPHPEAHSSPLSLTDSPTLGHNHLFFLTHIFTHTHTHRPSHSRPHACVHPLTSSYSPSTPHNMLTHTFTLISDHPHFLTGTLTLLLIHSHTLRHAHSHTPHVLTLPDSQAFCLSHSLMSMFFCPFECFSVLFCFGRTERLVGS